MRREHKDGLVLQTLKPGLLTLNDADNRPEQEKKTSETGAHGRCLVVKLNDLLKRLNVLDRAPRCQEKCEPKMACLLHGMTRVSAHSSLTAGRLLPQDW